jgi:competence protein ComEA
VGLDRKRLLAYAAIAVVVLAVGVRYLLAQHGAGSSSQGVVLSQPSAAASSSSASAAGGGTVGAAASAQPSAAPDLVVDVCGAVARPGVYHLPAGARVCDLLTAAGGATAQAELSAVNLAAKLADGQQVAVPERGQAAAVPPAGGSGGASSGGSGATTPTAPVNLNLATVEQLDALPGVGPSTAQKIVDYRTANGGFHSVEDLKNVSGIGDAKFAALKDLVTV